MKTEFTEAKLNGLQSLYSKLSSSNTPAGDETIVALAAAVDQLPNLQKEAISRLYLSEYNQEHLHWRAAGHMNLPEAAVEKLEEKALTTMRKDLNLGK